MDAFIAIGRGANPEIPVTAPGALLNFWHSTIIYRHSAAVWSYRDSLYTDQFQRLWRVFALDLKPEGDCLLHPFEQLVNCCALSMAARKGGNTLLDNDGVCQCPAARDLFRTCGLHLNRRMP